MIRQFYDVADRDDCLGDDSLCLELDAVSIIHAHRLQSRFITTQHFVMQAVISEQVLDNGDGLQEVDRLTILPDGLRLEPMLFMRPSFLSRRVLSDTPYQT